MNELFRDIKNIKEYFFQNKYKSVFFLLFLMMYDAVLEAIGVGIIPLYMAFLLNPSIIYKAPYLNELIPEIPRQVTPFLALCASFILAVIIGFKNISTLFTAYVQLKFVNGIQSHMSQVMFNVYQSAPYSWLIGKNSSELVRKIQHDTSEVANKVVMPMFDMIMNGMILVFILWVMIKNLHWMVMLILGVMSVGLFVLQVGVRKKIKENSSVIREEIKNNIKHIQQGIGAIIDTRLLGREEYIQRGFEKSVDRAAKARWIQGTFMRSISPLVEFLSVIVLLSTFLVLINVKSSLEESLPSMTLLVVAVTRLKQISTIITQSINNIHDGRGYLSSLFDDLGSLKKTPEIQKKTNTATLGKQFNELKIKNVFYTYDGVKNPAIHDISMHIKRGESIGLVGPTGSGKSTMVNVILGLLVPQIGEIKINDVKIKEDRKEWWKMIGYVPQSIYLIDDTIRANIAFGVFEDEIDEKRLKNAIISAQLEDFIKELSDGLETIVGERGVRLSGGQRQRIGIARALYPDPQVLVLDEATSALDNQTEKEVMTAIENLMGEKTMIMIAHRLTTVQKCDRLYLINKGSLTMSGKYDDLILESSEFKKMVCGLTEAIV